MTATETPEAVLRELNRLPRLERRRGTAITMLLLLIWAVIAGVLIISVTRLNAERQQLEGKNVNLTKEQLKLVREVATVNHQISAAKDQVQLLDRQRQQLNESIRGLQSELQALRDSAVREASLTTIYDAELKSDPNNAVLRNLRGYTLYRRGHTSEAITELQRSTVLSPGYVWGHYNYALALWAAGQHERAVQEVAFVLAIDPSFRQSIEEDQQFAPFRARDDFRALLRKKGAG